MSNYVYLVSGSNAWSGYVLGPVLEVDHFVAGFGVGLALVAVPLLVAWLRRLFLGPGE